MSRKISLQLFFQMAPISSPLLPRPQTHTHLSKGLIQRRDTKHSSYYLEGLLDNFRTKIVAIVVAVWRQLCMWLSSRVTELYVGMFYPTAHFCLCGDPATAQRLFLFDSLISNCARLRPSRPLGMCIWGGGHLSAGWHSHAVLWEGAEGNFQKSSITTLF